MRADRSSDEESPSVRIVKGNPTDDELAAVLAVLLSRREPAPASAQPSGWSAYWRNVRAPLTAGPGAWRSSARPG